VRGIQTEMMGSTRLLNEFTSEVDSSTINLYTKIHYFDANLRKLREELKESDEILAKLKAQVEEDYAIV